jgi:signal transduction histidine kinase
MRSGLPLAVALLVVALVGIISSSYAAYRYASARLNASLNERIEAAAREGLRAATNMAARTDGALWTEEEASLLQEELALLRRSLRLENLFVFDRDLRALADARPKIRPGKQYTLVHLSPEAVRRVLDGESFVDRKLSVESLSFRSGVVPLVSDGRVVGGVYAQASIAFESELRQLRRHWQVAGTVSVVVSVILILAVFLVHVRLSRMKDALNRRSRMDLVSLLSAGVAHDIKSPLTAIMAAGELLKAEHGDNRQTAEMVQHIQDGSRRILEIVQDLFGRRGPLEPGVTDVEPVVTALLRQLRPAAMEKGVDLGSDIEAGLRVNAPPSVLRMALANLLRNALEAVPAGKGRVRVSCRIERRAAGLAVSDNGPGIKPSMRRRIFDPLVTTKAEGSGLGLAVTRQMAEDMRGSLDLETEVGVGSTFVLWLPRGESGNGEDPGS